MKNGNFIDFRPRIKKWAFRGVKFDFSDFSIFIDFPGNIENCKKVEKMKNSIKSIFYPGYNFWQKMLAGGGDGWAEKFFRPPEEKNVDRKIVGKKIPG